MLSHFEITSIFEVVLRCPPFRAKATLAPARMPTQCILSLRTLNWTCLPPVCTKNIERRAKYGTFELTYECGVRSHAWITTAKEDTRQHFGAAFRHNYGWMHTFWLQWLGYEYSREYSVPAVSLSSRCELVVPCLFFSSSLLKYSSDLACALCPHSFAQALLYLSGT